MTMLRGIRKFLGLPVTATLAVAVTVGSGLAVAATSPRTDDAYQRVVTDHSNIETMLRAPDEGVKLADLQAVCRADVAAYNASRSAKLDQAEWCNVS